MRGSKLMIAGGVAFGLARAIRASRYSFRDKVALVTGGTRGLGLVLARQLIAQGAQVAICGRDEDTLRRAYDELSARAPGRVLAHTCELGERPQVEEVVARVQEHFGRIDVLVNNAGQVQVGPVDEMTLEDFETQMRVHFWGPLYATMAVLPSMRARQEGRIVNISSIGGKLAVPHLLPYSASKFALTGLSEGLRAELRRHGIRVTTVCPGLMRTGSPRNASFKGRHRAEYAWFKLSDSLPLSAIDADRAARTILRAVRRGEAEVVLSAPAKLAALFHGVFPGATSQVLSLVNLALPRPGGIGQAHAAGWQSRSPASEHRLNALTDRAAEQNNQV